MKTQFFSNVSHELRTPLALILGPPSVSSASSSPDDPDARRHRHRPAQRAHPARFGQRLARCLEPRVGPDRARVQRVRPRSSGTARSPTTSRRWQQTVPCTSSFAAPDCGVTAELDSLRVQQILLNLLSNAFKFTPPEGTVRLELHGPSLDGAVRVEVADSGPGIDRSRRDEVFERFHQLDGGVDAQARRRRPRPPHHARTGRRCTAGTIGIDDAPEGGALFIVKLPLVAPPGTRGARQSEQTKRHAPRTLPRTAGDDAHTRVVQRRRNRPAARSFTRTASGSLRPGEGTHHWCWWSRTTPT